MQNLVNKTSGYKTYAVAVLSAVYGVYQVFHGKSLNEASAVSFVLGGGLASLRAAVAKVEAALKSKK